MSVKLIHTVEHGNVEVAIRHRLTVKALCGLVFVPTTRHPKGLATCLKCEAKNARGSSAPHFVYRCFDADGELLYIGVTNSLSSRRISHMANSWWFPQMVSSRHVVYPSRLDALRVERRAIRKEQPLWNVRHQDFKAWTEERIALARSKSSALAAPPPVRRRFVGMAGA